ncbi:E3 ubiquitin-protein ligase NEDD4 [Varanus komodoensis]|nr:E3 ubiquitin-protein ligase NEDD4 [Varanus komodoensis]
MSVPKWVHCGKVWAVPEMCLPWEPFPPKPRTAISFQTENPARERPYTFKDFLLHPRRAKCFDLHRASPQVPLPTLLGLATKERTCPVAAPWRCGAHHRPTCSEDRPGGRRSQEGCLPVEVSWQHPFTGPVLLSCLSRLSSRKKDRRSRAGGGGAGSSNGRRLCLEILQSSLSEAVRLHSRGLAWKQPCQQCGAKAWLPALLHLLWQEPAMAKGTAPHRWSQAFGRLAGLAGLGFFCPWFSNKSRVKGHLRLKMTYLPKRNGSEEDGTEQAEELEPGWIILEQPDGLSQAQEEREAPLPAGWEERQDVLGRTYYVHHESRRTQWGRPAAQDGRPSVGSGGFQLEVQHAFAHRHQITEEAETLDCRDSPELGDHSRRRSHCLQQPGRPSAGAAKQLRWRSLPRRGAERSADDLRGFGSWPGGTPRCEHPERPHGAGPSRQQARAPSSQALSQQGLLWASSRQRQGHSVTSVVCTCASCTQAFAQRTDRSRRARATLAPSTGSEVARALQCAQGGGGNARHRNSRCASRFFVAVKAALLSSFPRATAAGEAACRLTKWRSVRRFLW